MLRDRADALEMACGTVFDFVRGGKHSLGLIWNAANRRGVKIYIAIGGDSSYNKALFQIWRQFFEAAARRRVCRAAGDSGKNAVW